MSTPESILSKTLQINKRSTEVIEAIAFVPALSAKYKIINTNHEQQTCTLSGDELSGDGVYIEITCSSNNHNSTDVTLAVRRKSGSFEKSNDVLLANQHIDTVLNLLSDSLALDPSEKSKLSTAKANEKTTGEHRQSQAIAEVSKSVSGGKQAPTVTKQMLIYAICCIVVLLVFYGLYKYIKQ